MRPVIYWNNLLSVAADAEDVDQEDDGFQELQDASIGIAAPLRPSNSSSVSGVYQEWLVSGAQPFSRPVLAVVSASAELDGFGVNVSGDLGPGSGQLALYGVMSGTGPAVFQLYGDPTSGAARVKQLTRWRIAITQASAVVLPVGEDQDGFSRTNNWPQLQASGQWVADTSTGADPNFAFALTEDPESVLYWAGLGITSGAAVSVLCGDDNGGTDGVTFTGLFNLSGFRPAQWDSFRVYQRWFPNLVSGAVFILSGVSGALTWAVPSGQLFHASAGKLQPVNLSVASAVLSGSASFEATAYRVSGLRNSATGPSFKLDAIIGTKVDPLPGHPQMFELGMFEELRFPRDHQVGVERTTILRRTRLTPPGVSPITLREGDDLRQTAYELVTTRAETVSGVQAFLEQNDAGTPFLFRDDRGALYWAEMPEPAEVFQDNAGVYTYTLTIREIRP